MEAPLVSIVIPSFNSEKYISETLESALSQTYENYEIIVVNDGSTDSTAEILSEYEKTIKIINTDNNGISIARNIGILNSSGEYIALLDSDDLWHPKKLKLQVDHLIKNPEIAMISCSRMKFSDPKEIAIKEEITLTNIITLSHLTILYRNPINCSSVLIRKNILSYSGIFDPRIKSAAEDTELWARIARVGTVVLNKDPISWVRNHDQRTTKSFNYRENRLKTFTIMERYWAKDPEATKIIRKNYRGNLVAVAYEAADDKNFKIAKNNFKKAFMLDPTRAKFLAKYVYYLLRSSLAD